MVLAVNQSDSTFETIRHLDKAAPVPHTRRSKLPCHRHLFIHDTASAEWLVGDEFIVAVFTLQTHLQSLACLPLPPLLLPRPRQALLHPPLPPMHSFLLSTFDVNAFNRFTRAPPPYTHTTGVWTAPSCFADTMPPWSLVNQQSPPTSPTTNRLIINGFMNNKQINK